jgi:hypothetical protein
MLRHQCTIRDEEGVDWSASQHHQPLFHRRRDFAGGGDLTRILWCRIPRMLSLSTIKLSMDIHR